MTPLLWFAAAVVYVAVVVLIVRFFMVCERKNGADW